MPKGTVYSLMDDVISPMDDPEAFLKKAYGWVKDKVHADEKVGLAVSGGVDSSVVARMLRDSIGENLYLIHMDHGFMRLIEGREESDIVLSALSDYPKVIYRNDVRDRFYRAVEGIEDGDEKRAAFRETYKTALNETMEDAGCVWTSDGTIYPDIRETRGGIKLQHNVDLGFAQKKLEPLASLSKQEVRALAKYLGMPHLRQPFPGPGLLVRTVGKYSPEKLEVEKKANDIVEQEYRKFMLGRYGKEMIIDGETGMQIPFQTFAATFDCKEKQGRNHSFFLDVKVTGLEDDGVKYNRIYKEPLLIVPLPRGIPLPKSYLEYADGAGKLADSAGTCRVLYQLDEKSFGRFAVAVRAIDSIDVKKAVPNFSGNVPELAAKRILEEIPDVKAVFFDITPKPPATVEYE